MHTSWTTISSFIIALTLIYINSQVSAHTTAITNQGDSSSQIFGGPDFDAFKAIRSLHTKLDVDADGEVDDLESKRFLELEKNKAPGSSNAQKLRYLHQDGKDKSISVDELWQSWKNSQVYNWTVDQTVYWLVNYVELPEYSNLFEEYQLNGTVLPRLATDLQYLSKLGISEPSAKSKISIKAMDVVLFGPPKIGNQSKLRDIVVSLIIVIAISACYVFYSRSRASQLALLAMKYNLDSMQKTEDQISELQKELDKSLKAQQAVVTEKRNLEHQLEMHRQFSATSLHELQNKSDLSVSDSETTKGRGDDDPKLLVKYETELEELRKELQETTDSMYARKFRAPAKLRSLLRATYNMESQYYNEKKLSLESKATDVKLRNQKLQRKKTSFLGYYKIAQENSLEEDLNTIVEVKEAFQKVTKEIKERNERWREIEDLCGCPLDLIPIQAKPPSLE